MLLFLLACLPSQPSSPIDPVGAMRTRPLKLTRHAECRMECRKIDMQEVQSVLATGTFKPERSRNTGACPSHALEGPDSEGGPLRIVFAACEEVTKVITAIDLDDDFPCSCR